MNFTEIQKIAKKLYAPVFALEYAIPHRIRHTIEFSFRILFAVLLASSLGLFVTENVFGINNVSELVPKVFGATSLVFVLWMILFVLESFYYSYYYRDQKFTNGLFMDFDLAHTIDKISLQDVIAGFFSSNTGSVMLLRCGVSPEDFEEFLSNRKNLIDANHFECHILDNKLNLRSFIEAIIDEDAELADFLFKYGIQKKELSGIAEWIMEMNEVYSNNERWWSKENLGRIPSIGQGWSYGKIYTLEKYERPLSLVASSRYSVHSSYGVKELKELENVLSRSRDANVVLVGNDQAGSLNIISHLSQMITEGTVVAELKHKRVVLLDSELLVSSTGSKASFELELITIMKEAIYAGNVLMVLPDLPSFISSTSSIGVDLPSLIEPYLSSPNLQVIALSNTERFHQSLEQNGVLAPRFENIFIKDIDDSNTIKVLENEIIRFEREGLFFTYLSLSAIVEGAERYFSDGVMPDKAIDLLLEIVPKLKAQGKKIVEKQDVLSLIESKTGIPMGEVGTIEKEKLLNLETILHRRIIGQDEAIVAISNAVRRARSGVNSPDRPLGSFLFLGPTGVGKTETTKALADAFFGAEAHILRLDMSEYNSSDATSKLIGSFEGKQSGVLSTMLREHPYGVLLLDEFEKTTSEVMNLFLQVLDEGFFSDMAGKKVGARNLIIIATSNAGSDLIWEAMQSGQDLSGIKDLVTDNIIKNGIFKPELLNRFDGVILFHPLNNDHLRQIAELMLKKLHSRLSEKGMNLVVDDNLINFVVSFGTDPKFGARPMNRAIQEKVEEMIAKKIISGSIQKGSHILLTPEELV